MKAYVGIDDTDIIGSPMGTGKLARALEQKLPPGCHLWAVARQQLLQSEAIPYTSHNSAACLILELDAPASMPALIETTIRHVEALAVEGSDPGVCAFIEKNGGPQELLEFGRICTQRKVSQEEALNATKGLHLSGHGGTNDGIIGAAAAVGLTASGWNGRFIEFGRLRDLPERIQVARLNEKGIQVMSIDRDARVPAPDDWINTRGWVRPRLVGHMPVLLVRPVHDGEWENIGKKRKK